MFRFRSDYINENSSYTEIRNALHDAYKSKGENAGLRFLKGRGLYVKNDKSDFRKWFDSEAETRFRKQKFENAASKLKAAIDREYAGWIISDPVLGKSQSLGDYVFNNLRTRGARLDLEALNHIDELIVRGMAEAAVGQPYKLQAIEDRDELFNDLRNARDLKAGRDVFARFRDWWSGDNSVEQAAQRAANWRNIVNSDRMLRKALAADLKASGVRGDRVSMADEKLRDLGALHVGLTPETFDKLVQDLRDEGYKTDSLEKLAPYVLFKQNIAVNLKQLREVNQRILAGMGGTENLVVLSHVEQGIKTSNGVLSEIAQIHSQGGFEDQQARCYAYDRLRDNYEFLLKQRPFIEKGYFDHRNPGHRPAVRKVASLLDKQLAATHDLALSLGELEESAGRAKLPGFNYFAEANAHREVNEVPVDSLNVSLPSPKKIFDSGDATNRDIGLSIQNYNDKCKDVVLSLADYKNDQSAENIGQLHDTILHASKVNDGVLTRFSRLNALGGQASSKIMKQLQAQRETLQALKVAIMPEYSMELHLTPSNSPEFSSSMAHIAGQRPIRWHYAWPSQSHDTNNSGANKHKVEIKHDPRNYFDSPRGKMGLSWVHGVTPESENEQSDTEDEDIGITARLRSNPSVFVPPSEDGNSSPSEKVYVNRPAGRSVYQRGQSPASWAFTPTLEPYNGSSGDVSQPYIALDNTRTGARRSRDLGNAANNYFTFNGAISTSNATADDSEKRSRTSPSDMLTVQVNKSSDSPETEVHPLETDLVTYNVLKDHIDDENIISVNVDKDDVPNYTAHLSTGATSSTLSQNSVGSDYWNNIMLTGMTRTVSTLSNESSNQVKKSVRVEDDLYLGDGQDNDAGKASVLDELDEQGFHFLHRHSSLYSVSDAPEPDDSTEHSRNKSRTSTSHLSAPYGPVSENALETAQRRSGGRNVNSQELASRQIEDESLDKPSKRARSVDHAGVQPHLPPSQNSRQRKPGNKAPSTDSGGASS